jgi:hypothetical protein
VPTTGNCAPQDGTETLNSLMNNSEPNILPNMVSISDCIYDEYPIIVEELDNYCKDTVTYIGGYIERKIRNKLDCTYCLSVLTNDDRSGNVGLINTKNRGKLVYTCNDIQEICCLAESIFRQFEEKKN